LFCFCSSMLRVLSCDAEMTQERRTELRTNLVQSAGHQSSGQKYC
jgi:hypothetical protein